MTTQILAIIGSILAIIIGLWKYSGRKNAERRKLADEAKEKLDEAHKNKDKSSLLDSWDRAKRMQ
ncbi:MAG: hypothetical protein QME65_03950 [Candidatus Omnitrophota bacterium]|nr:hypothetical protein [Candidatus Omnitrophota bacterium]